jgi:hypothetical protein
LGVLDSYGAEAGIEVARETFEIAQRYGERTWTLQAIGTGIAASFETGRWEDWQEEARAALPDASSFYRAWFQSEEARRLAYRGRSDEAERLLREVLAEPGVQNSAQATAATAGLEAEIRMTQGRWIEAFDASRRAWNQPDQAVWTTQLGQLAAAAAGDASRLQDAAQAQASAVRDDFPMSQAYGQVALTLASLLSGRWDEARLEYLNARRMLDEVGHAQALAQLQLAVGHKAADHFAEASDAAREAEEYFHARGADAYVATYRAHAVKEPAVGEESPTRVTSAEVAEAEPSSR